MLCLYMKKVFILIHFVLIVSFSSSSSLTSFLSFHYHFILIIIIIIILISSNLITRADRILLLFDAHKLDISDEFKSAIEMLKGHDDKIRVVLNKADMVTNQQLMRIYGALMWSLGKVVRTPEVLRVYIGSFWDEPLNSKGIENQKLFEAEEIDLLSDMRSLPRNSSVRKINELVKRSRLSKVHALVMSHLRDQMPNLWGHKKQQEKLLTHLDEEFSKVQRRHSLPRG